MSVLQKKIQAYSTLVFDCDGVVLDSNKVKTQAFYDVAKVYGHEPAQALTDYHTQNGGVSRYAKFEYFLTKILNQPLDEALLKQLSDQFASKVKQALLQCDVVDGLLALKDRVGHARWLIVSGGDQAELREVFAERGLANLFDGGIFGSPDTKDSILEREIENNNVAKPALFLGDSKYDYQAATAAGLDFIFLTQWTEVSDFSEWVKVNSIETAASISCL